MTTILVTGGAGYIGSHTCVALLEAGYQVVVVDNFCNSKPLALQRVQAIAGRALVCIRADVRDAEALRQVFAQHRIDGVIHFAGLKAVGESAAMPLAYYDTNVHGSVTLAQVMAEFGVELLVFSSSATVYGDPARCPVPEDAPLAPTNPYGRSKWMMEQIYTDLAASDPRWRIALLRYFNPAGAHPSGTIGEDPNGVPNNLLPFISQVAVGRRPHLNVWGRDYPTPDGTGIRDYIHVMDLADGHVSALQWLAGQRGIHAFNLGTGHGASVLDMVRAFEAASGRAIACQFAPRRSGDIAMACADPSKAGRTLGWKATRSIEAMCADSWNWQKNNPDGYPDHEPAHHKEAP